MSSLRSPAARALRQTLRRAAPAPRPSVSISNHIQRATYASAKDRSAGPPLTNPLNIPKWCLFPPSNSFPPPILTPPSQARNKLPPPQTARQQPPNLQRPPHSHDRRRPQRPHRLPHQLDPGILLPAQRPHAAENHRAHHKRVSGHIHQ